MRKRGRPTLPEAEKRGNRVTVFLKDAELTALERLAGELRIHPAEAAYRSVQLVLKQRAQGGSFESESLDRSREQTVDKHIARGVLRREQRREALRACGSTRAELLVADKFWSAQEEDRRG